MKTSKTAAVLDTTGLALLLYRRHFGVTPVRVEAAPPLDVAAAWTADGKTLTIGVVNPTRKTLKVPLAVAGARLGGGRRWRIAGGDAMVGNEPGEAPRVTIEEAVLRGVGGRLILPPCSVSLYALAVDRRSSPPQASPLQGQARASTPTVSRRKTAQSLTGTFGRRWGSFCCEFSPPDVFRPDFFRTFALSNFLN